MTTAETTGPTFIEILRLSARDLRSAAGEVPDVATDFRELVAGDVQLGIAEMRESATRAGGAAAIAGVAALLADIGLFFACITVMFALSTAMALWLSALITMLIVFAVAFIAYRIAMARFKSVTPMPKRAVQSLGKDLTWLRAQIKLSEN
jgi:uncharacterized membrane protein YqjE